MSIIEENINLKEFNTFNISAEAKSFAKFDNLESLKELQDKVNFNKEKILILGGGSNILFTQDFDGLVLKNEVKGFQLLSEDENHYEVKIGAGENWHNTVLKAVENNWSGIENLSLIPGNCGAAPMQNIGAYGVEIKEVLKEVEAFHIPTGEVHTISKDLCKLGYRESIFKNEVKGEYIILNITLVLNKNPEFRISYGAIQKELERMNVSDLSIKEISKAVINIRQSKLPNPEEIGNAGSFFKNPVIDQRLFEKLKEKHPDIPNYPAENGVKLAAGWLIERAGWKGKTFGNYGVHKNQALVLVNYGDAKGIDIYNLSSDIQEDVRSKFEIDLVREVNII